MAENVAIMLCSEVGKRHKAKKDFKGEVYPLRNKIMHNGKTIENEKDLINLGILEAYVVWSIRGIISRIDDIVKYGNNTKAIREYFEREKLK